MSNDESNPLFGAAPTEIPLPAAPLVTVLWQVRFPEIVSIQQKSFIAGFQEAIRDDFPLLVEDLIDAIQIDEPSASVSRSRQTVWRFVDETAKWRISLSSSFLTLETRAYRSRADFADRFGKILSAAAQSFRPTHATRIGVRYVDRIPLRNEIALEELFRPEMMGLVGSKISESVVHSISEVMCKTEEGSMQARWGKLPERGSHDPDVMPPISDACWFLDLDTFSDYQKTPIRFEAEMIRDDTVKLSTRTYSFFRWATTPAFLRAFGGEPK